MPFKTVCVGLMLLLVLVGADNGRARENQAYGPIPFAQHLGLDKALKRLDAGNIPEAVSLLEAIITKAETNHDTVHPLVLFNLGNAYMGLNQPDKALASYEACVAAAPMFSIAWLNLAKVCFDLNRFIRAGDAMVSGYRTSTGKNFDHLYYAASAYISGKAYDKAIAILEKPFTSAEKAQVKNPWREALVHVYLTVDRPESALPHIQYLAEHTQGDHRLRWQETLLYQYMSLGMNRQALDYVTYLTTEYPDEPKWWKGMTHFYLGENNYAAALTAMTIYGYLSPMTDAEKRLTADLNLSVGIPSRAVTLLEELLKSSPSPELIVKLIQALEQMNARERALAWAEKGMDDYPGNREIAMLRGELLFSLERYGEAAAIFTPLTAADNSGKAWLMLGYSAWNSGDLKTARQAMQKAAEFKLQKPQARKALDQLNGS